NSRRLSFIGVLILCSTISDLQSAEKSDQGVLVIYGQLQPELVARHSACSDAVGVEAGRDVVRANPPVIEPVLECGDPAAVPERAAIPDALQRRDFIESRAAPRLERQVRIRADGESHDVVLLKEFL